MMLKLALITLLNPVTVGEYTIVKSPKAGDSIKYAMKAELKASKELAGVLADEKSILQRNVASLKNKLSKYEDENRVVAMPGLKGSVVAVDPKWEFVVLNVGSQQGALEGGLLMVRRGDKLVGKVKIVSVEANRSVANVLPAWKQGDVAVATGDLVLY